MSPIVTAIESDVVFFALYKKTATISSVIHLEAECCRLQAVSRPTRAESGVLLTTHIKTLCSGHLDAKGQPLQPGLAQVSRFGRLRSTTRPGNYLLFSWFSAHCKAGLAAL